MDIGRGHQVPFQVPCRVSGFHPFHPGRRRGVLPLNGYCYSVVPQGPVCGTTTDCLFLSDGLRRRVAAYSLPLLVGWSYSLSLTLPFGWLVRRFRRCFSCPPYPVITFGYRPHRTGKRLGDGWLFGCPAAVGCSRRLPCSAPRITPWCHGVKPL